MATNLDPESKSDSTATSILARLPSLEVQVGAADAEPADGATECRTPTSEEHRIPPVLSCPPPPRKPRAKPAGPCKRSFPSDQLELFEVGDLFRSCDGAAGVAKRRRFFCK